jgi:uncharacterized protein (TIGR02996 family)
MSRPPSYFRHPDYLVLVAACRAAPEDDTQRLILADWVQEQGDEPQAELLRAFNLFAAEKTFREMSESVRKTARSFRDLVVSIGESLRPAFEALRLSPELRSARKPRNEKS